jgi:catalase
VMPFEDAMTYRINPFDLTKTWPHEDYPLMEVGKLTLDANPVDWDTQIEQLAFEPNNMVPGIGLSPDKMLLARGFSYSDAHRARLGVNYKQIPVNQAKAAEVHSYSRAGQGRTVNAVDPVYAPNSYGGPGAQPEVGGEATWMADGDMVRAAYTLREDDDDWSQPGALVRQVMDDAQRDRFVNNVAGHLADGVSEPILERAFAYWCNVDKGIGDRIEKATRKILGGKSDAPGMASANSISCYQGIPATSSIAKGEGRKNAVMEGREVASAK